MVHATAISDGPQNGQLGSEERVTICKAIAVACMWGHGGIGSVIIESLDKKLPRDPTWKQLYDANIKEAKREAVGVITDETLLRSRLERGYHLTNWDEDGCSLFNPPPMNGLSAYVAKDLAEKFSWPPKR